MNQSLHNGSSRVPLMEALGKIFKGIIPVTPCSSEILLHIVLVYGLSKAKWELSVTSVFYKQEGILQANMAFIYLVSNYTEYFPKCNLLNLQLNSNLIGHSSKVQDFFEHDNLSKNNSFISAQAVGVYVILCLFSFNKQMIKQTKDNLHIAWIKQLLPRLT